MNSCIFCKIVNGSVPASIVYEDEKVLAFMDIEPINPGHVLVIPKAHFKELGDMDETTGGHLFKVAMKVERAIRKADIHCEGVNLLQNNGEAAFQEVMHVHLHVIPRYSGDGLKVEWGAEKAEREALNMTAMKIKQWLPKNN